MQRAVLGVFFICATHLFGSASWQVYLAKEDQILFLWVEQSTIFAATCDGLEWKEPQRIVRYPNKEVQGLGGSIDPSGCARIDYQFEGKPWGQVTMDPLKAAGDVVGAGTVKINQFPMQKEWINVLSWQVDDLTGIASFNIYREGMLIGNVLVTETFEYKDRNRPKDTFTIYQIIPVDGNGIELQGTTIGVQS